MKDFSQLTRQSLVDVIQPEPLGVLMRARRIIQIGAFVPEDVERLQTAFDTAWASLAPTIPESEHAQCREILATVIVAAGNVSGLDPLELSNIAIRTFRSVRAAGQPLL